MNNGDALHEWKEVGEVSGKMRAGKYTVYNLFSDHWKVNKYLCY